MLPAMSRRSRRRRGKAPSRGSWWLRGTGALLALALVAMAGGWLWLRSWLHSEDFRRMLSAEAGKSLGVDARFGRFDWDGTRVTTERFEAEGDGLVERIDAEGLQIDIGLGKVRQRVVELREAAIREIEVVLDLRGSAGEARPEAEAPPSDPLPRREAWYEGLLPNEVRLTGLEIGNSSLVLRLDAGDASFSGTRWSVVPEGRQGSYEVEAGGGTVRFPWEFVPELALRKGRLRYHDRSVFLTESRFDLYQRGHLELAGEASLAGEGMAFDGELRDVRADEVLPEDWKQRVEGELESDFSLVQRDGSLAVRGTLRLLNGVLTGLPVLDHLGAYGGNPRFRRLALSEGSVDFHWEDGALALSDIRVGSEGLMRVEGQLRVDPEKNLDGRFRVGLTPGTLASIPGAETKVFLPGERGLLWTPLRITGTVDDPEEDLSSRLIAAAGLRMFEILPETGERVLKFTRQVASEDLLSQIEQGRVVIDQGTDLLRQGGRLLDGEGNLVEEAGEVIRQGEEVIRQGEDVVKGVRGLLDVLGGDPVPAEPSPEGAE